MKKIIPFGDRILVRRRKIGEKSGSLYLPEQTADRAIDLADVIYIPDLTFADKALLENSEKIIDSLKDKAIEGNSDALIALLRLNEFIKIKSIKVGDCVFISKYVGTDAYTSDNKDLTVLNESDIMGVVRDEK